MDMMNLKLEARLLKEWFSTARTLVDELIMTFPTPGPYPNNDVNSTIVDGSHIAMAEVKIPQKSFAEYQYAHKFDIKWGLDIENLEERFLKYVKPEEQIQIRAYMGKKNNKSMQLFEFKRGALHYTTPGINPAGIIDPKKPSTSNLKEWVVIPVEELKQICVGAQPISNELELSINSENFKAYAISKTGETVDLPLPLKDLEHEYHQDVKSKFSLEYITKMVKSVPTPSVKLKLGNDYLLHAEYDLSKHDGKIIYLLAPRVDDGKK